MSELEIDVAVFTIVIAIFTTVFCKIKGRMKLKHLQEELTQAKASLLNAETEIRGLKIALGEKSKIL